MNRSRVSTTHDDSVSYEVVTEIAEAEGVDPLELTPPLYEVIDPDTLDQICAKTPTAGRMEVEVTFSYKGYEVTVRGDGDVSVEE